MTFSERLAESAITKSGLAAAIGVQPSAITNYLTGASKPSLPVAMKIAKVLDATVEELFGHLVDDDQETPDA